MDPARSGSRESCWPCSPAPNLKRHEGNGESVTPRNEAPLPANEASHDPGGGRETRRMVSTGAM